MLNSQNRNLELLDAARRLNTFLIVLALCQIALALYSCAQVPKEPMVVQEIATTPEVYGPPTPENLVIPEPIAAARQEAQASRSTRPPAFTDSEIEMVIRVVIAEAGIEPYEGQQAVAQCIYDRVHHSNKRLYGTGVEGVLTKPHQYTKPYKGDINKFPNAIKAVHSVFLEGHRVFEETAVIFFDPRYSGKEDMRVLRRYNYLGTIGGHEFRGDRKDGK